MFWSYDTTSKELFLSIAFPMTRLLIYRVKHTQPKLHALTPAPAVLIFTLKKQPQNFLNKFYSLQNFT